jgi:hypothetical protein
MRDTSRWAIPGSGPDATVEDAASDADIISKARVTRCGGDIARIERTATPLQF